MTFVELTQAIRAKLPPDLSYCIDVEYWDHRTSKRVTWKLYLAFGSGGSAWIEGKTPEELLLNLAEELRKPRTAPETKPEASEPAGLEALDEVPL